MSKLVAPDAAEDEAATGTAVPSTESAVPSPGGVLSPGGSSGDDAHDAVMAAVQVEFAQLLANVETVLKQSKAVATYVTGVVRWIRLTSQLYVCQPSVAATNAVDDRTTVRWEAPPAALVHEPHCISSRIVCVTSIAGFVVLHNVAGTWTSRSSITQCSSDSSLLKH